MAAKRLFGAVAVVLTATLTGCCEWAKNHCDACRAPVAQPALYAPPPCCTPAPTCCTPGYAPAPAPAAPAQWQRPAYGQPCCQ